MQKSENDFALVLLCVKSNIQETVKNLGVYQKFLSPKKIVVIGARELGQFVPIDGSTSFCDEDTILGGLTLRAVRDEISAIESLATHRAGWYFQQFLKLSYAFACKEESDLAWDADTIPLHEVQMIQDGKKLFDVKTEYNEAYFDTIAKILPWLKKENDFSFISEHMLFESAIVREMIQKIEDASALPFWKIILRSIEKSRLQGSAFSEFETYGTYVTKFYPEKYGIRKWKSFRDEAVFFPNGVSVTDFNKLGMKYDAKSFENHESQKKLSRFLGHKIFQNRFFISLFIWAKEGAKKIIMQKENRTWAAPRG